MYNDPSLYNTGITVGLMDYNPIINSVLPYGIATFNRRGVYLGVNYTDINKLVNLDAKVYQLSEIRGQGTTFLKSFLMGNVTTTLNAEKFWEGDKALTLMLSLNQQNSTRDGDMEFQTVDLNSTQINLGVEAELVEDIFLMGNILALNAEGTDQYPVRNDEGVIINYEEFSVEGSEVNISGGLRIDFSKKSYLACMYECYSNNLSINNPYLINQASLFYVLKF